MIINTVIIGILIIGVVVIAISRMDAWYEDYNTRLTKARRIIERAKNRRGPQQTELPRYLLFGDTTADRVRATLQQEGYKVEFGFVEYYISWRD